MASDAPESSRARKEPAAEREEASEEVVRQRPWVALSSIPVVYGPGTRKGAEAFVGGADLSLELQSPPRPTYLALPERLAPDPRRLCPSKNFPYIIAANSDRLLFMATQGGSSLAPSYFLCNLHDGTATRLPAVPVELGVRLFPRRTMGLIADPRHDGNYMVVQLRPVAGTDSTRHDVLLCYSSATGQWTLKRIASEPDHEPWGAHGAFAHAGRLWWVDIAYGMLACDPFDDNPHLRFVPLPIGCEMQGLGGGQRPTVLMDERRCIRLSQGKLRYVEIRGLSYDPAAVNDPPDNPSVSMWTLVNPEGPDPWRFVNQAPFASIWEDASYVATSLPNKVPKLAFVDPNNHDVIYFFQDRSLFALSLRMRRVLACEEFWVDRVVEDLELQYSRFVDALVLRGDDPASSDGGSGTKGTDDKEELDGATGSDEELAHLLSQLEIKSQPDKEHSLSELLIMVADDAEGMASPPEPSLEAEAGEQADEP